MKKIVGHLPLSKELKWNEKAMVSHLCCKRFWLGKSTPPLIVINFLGNYGSHEYPIVFTGWGGRLGDIRVIHRTPWVLSCSYCGPPKGRAQNPWLAAGYCGFSKQQLESQTKLTIFWLVLNVSVTWLAGTFRLTWIWKT